MDIVKQAQGGQTVAVTEEQLEQISRFSRRPMKAEEVYCFSVRLCDNQVDRDGERFPRKTLEELAELFVGKSGLFDHSWSARGQAARIYAAQVVQEEKLTGTGEPYCWLKGYAYMVRTADNEGLIREIEGGIKKDYATFSYFFVTSGLASFVLIAAGIAMRRLNVRFSALVKCGQNPMVAYTAAGFLIMPLLTLLHLAPYLQTFAELCPWMGVVRGVLVTAAVMAVTVFFTNRRLFWRT